MHLICFTLTFIDSVVFLLLVLQVFYIRERKEQEMLLLEQQAVVNKKGKAIEIPMIVRKHLPEALQDTDEIEIKTVVSILTKF